MGEIGMCTDSVHYQVLLNGESVQPIYLGVYLGHKPCFICASQVIVRGCMRWRIGNSRRIKMGSKHWIR